MLHQLHKVVRYPFVLYQCLILDKASKLKKIIRTVSVTAVLVMGPKQESKYKIISCLCRNKHLISKIASGLNRTYFV